MSNQSTSKSTSGGVGVCGLLLVAFVVLKLCHVIAWSWWWVLAPLWMPMALVLVVLLIAFALHLFINAD